MLNPKVSEVVEQTRPGKRVSLILTVESSDYPTVKDIPDRRERAQRLNTFYQIKKKPIIERFVVYEKSGLRINPLSGTPNLIISAPARLWKRVIREAPFVFSDPHINVTTNDAVFTALPGVYEAPCI